MSYTYDSLNWLIAAAATGSVQWGFSYGYDGFGNLTAKTRTQGTPPLVPTPPPLIVDSNTNRVRLSGDYGYDANGNWLGAAGAPNTWNVENQLISTGMVDGDGNPITYTYDPWGRRVLQFSASNYGPSATLYFYSITGQRLATYSAGYPTDVRQLSVSVYFGARPLKAMDRLGSVRYDNSSGAIAYFPWGEERPRSDGTLTADATDKFATYFRDGFGQDYAHSRYYNSNMGRFWTPDPGWMKSSKQGDPGTYDRYAYSLNDPINFFDPVGRNPCDDPQDDGNDACGADPGAGDGWGGGGGGATYSVDSHCTNTFGDGCLGSASTPPDPNPTDPPPDDPFPPDLGQQPVSTQPRAFCTTWAPQVAFLQNNMADATALAANLKVPVAFVLAVSAAESTYGTSLAAVGSSTTPGANNYFGIHWVPDGPAAQAGAAGPWAAQPSVAAWKPGSDGYLGSGNAFVNYATSDGARGVTNPQQFFTDISKQFGIGTPGYVSDMLGVLKAVTSFMGCL